MAEAMSTQTDAALTYIWEELEAVLPHCECRCTESDPRKVIGWCVHCRHVYADYSPKIEAKHFVGHCPGAPAALKQAAWTSLAKQATKRQSRNPSSLWRK